jgi:lysozyme family protein
MAIDIGGMLARSGATTGQLMRQGLVNLGTGIGAGVGGMLTRRKEREEAEKLKAMGPVDQADYMLSRAKTPQQIASAQALKSAAVKAGSQTSVANLELARQQALAAGNDEEALRIENIMKRVAVEGNLGSATLSNISGRTNQEIKARNDAAYQLKVRAATEAATQREAMIENRAAILGNSNAPLNQSVDALDIPEEDKAEILKKATDIRKLRNSNREAVESEKLGTYHTQYLKNNPSLANNPSVLEALTTIKGSTASPGAKRQAVKDIISLIEKDFERKEKERNSKDRVELEAELAISHVSGLESPSEGVIGRDLIEVINDEYPVGSESREELVKFVTSLMLENPELRNNPEQAVIQGLNLITGDKPGFDAELETGRREAVVQKAAMRAAYKQELIDEGKSEAEAEAQIRKEEAKASRYRARTTQGM